MWIAPSGLRRSCPTTPRMKSTALRRLSRSASARRSVSAVLVRCGRAGRDRARGRRDRRRRGGAGARPRRAARPRGCRRGARPSRRTRRAARPRRGGFRVGTARRGRDAMRSAPASTTSTARPPATHRRRRRRRDRPRRRSPRRSPSPTTSATESIAGTASASAPRRRRSARSSGSTARSRSSAAGERAWRAGRVALQRLGAQGVLWHRRTSWGPPAARGTPRRAGRALRRRRARRGCGPVGLDVGRFACAFTRRYRDRLPSRRAAARGSAATDPLLEARE